MPSNTSHVWCCTIFKVFTALAASVTMIGRQCLPACIISPALESSEISITPPPRAASMRLSRGTTSSPVPRRSSVASEAVKTPERVKKIGEVYFVLDETMVLVTLPDKTKLDKGVILLALPIHRTGEYSLEYICMTEHRCVCRLNRQ